MCLAGSWFLKSPTPPQRRLLGALRSFALAVGASAVATSAARAQAPLAGERVLIVEGVTALVGTEFEPTADATIVVRDGRITEIVGPDDEVEAITGAEIVDASGGYLIPGLVDSHIHLGTVPDREQATAEMERLLQAGVTSVRDMAGDARFLNDLARASITGEIAGPRLYFSALMAGPTFFSDPRPQASAQGAVAGQVPWMQILTADTDLPVAMAVAKGTSATGIKLYANMDGLLVWRASREAHRYGLQVWAHSAVFPARPLEVVKSGADVISHACRLAWEAWKEIPGEYHHDRSPTAEGYDPEHPILGTLVKEMVKRGTVLDATLALYARRARTVQGRGPQCDIDQARELVRRAHRAGVPVAAGTDFTTPLDEPPPLLEELQELHENAGFTATEALRAATLNGALALGVAADFGTVEVGKVADLVILGADPTDDLANLRDVLYVIRDGRVMRRP